MNMKELDRLKSLVGLIFSRLRVQISRTYIHIMFKETNLWFLSTGNRNHECFSCVGVIITAVTSFLQLAAAVLAWYKGGSGELAQLS